MMDLSPGAVAALCTAPTFFNQTINIINVDMGSCYNLTTYNKSMSTCHTYWFSTAPNITAISPTAVEEDPSSWTFKPQPELNASFPLSKALLIDCPMPACAFPISGTYSDLQRYLLYVNLLFAVVATTSPLLRGIAQLFLATTAMSSLLHFVVIFALRDKQLVDMDFTPALMYSLTGIVSTLVWCLFRSPSLTTTLGHFLIFQFIPLLAVWLGLIILIAFLSTYQIGHRLSAVLLESETAFRLTSICYGGEGGETSLWPGPFNYAIRQSGELQFILVPESGDALATAPVVQPIPLNSIAIGMAVIFGTYFVFWTVGAITARWGHKSRAWTMSLSFLSHFPEAFQRL
jgi:hypothetical protein